MRLAVRRAARVPEDDIAERASVDQVGFSLTGAQVAELLGRSGQAVSKDGWLLRLPRSDGRPAYPCLQFDERRQIPGVAEVVKVLSGSLTPAGIAAWMTGINPLFRERRPVDVLGSGEIELVVSVARRLAERADR